MVTGPCLSGHVHAFLYTLPVSPVSHGSVLFTIGPCNVVPEGGVMTAERGSFLATVHLFSVSFKAARYLGAFFFHMPKILICNTLQGVVSYPWRAFLFNIFPSSLLTQPNLDIGRRCSACVASKALLARIGQIVYYKCRKGQMSRCRKVKAPVAGS